MSREEVLQLVQVGGEERDGGTSGLELPPPQSTRKELKVDRTSAVGSKLGSIALSGVGGSRNYRYKSEDNDIFFVDPLTGDVILIGSLTDVKLKEFTLEVSVKY